METVRKILLTLSALCLVAAFGCTKTATDLSGTSSGLPLFNYNNCYGAACATFPGLTPTPTPVPGSTPAPGGVSNPAVPTPTPLSVGATGQLTIVDQNTFNTYVGAPLNNPSLIQINIQLHPTSDSPQVFLGSMHIRYNDDQGGGFLILHDGTFLNGSSSANGNNVNTLQVDAGSGIPTYRIFFEDRAGAIILTLQPSSGATFGGDTGSTINGKIWFRNFASSAPNPLYDSYYENTPYCNVYGPNCIWYAGLFYNQFPSNPNAYCWAGAAGTAPVIGPYDCRNMTVPPSTGGDKPFTLLGTVSNIDFRSALGL